MFERWRVSRSVGQSEPVIYKELGNVIQLYVDIAFVKMITRCLCVDVLCMCICTCMRVSFFCEVFYAALVIMLIK
jgi:hypothetical protein